MTSATTENYLKALFALANETGEINLSDLSVHLGVSKPAVNSMVKTMNQEGLVKYKKYKPLKMTKKGRIAAASVIRKHRLTEMFLAKKMDFGWEEVHEIAEQIEHIKSSKFFERMDKLLDFPKVDPHGSPIPDKYGNIINGNYKRLSECEVGDNLRLVALDNSSREFLEFLDSRDICLNLSIEIKSIEQFDSSMLISYSHHPSETLSHKVSEKLLVEKV